MKLYHLVMIWALCIFGIAETFVRCGLLVPTNNRPGILRVFK